MIRFLCLYFKYILEKLINFRTISFHGFTVVFAYPGSSIFLLGKRHKKITINSSPLSNLVGMSQRTIIVARNGGKIEIGAGCGISGSTIYAMEKIRIGEDVLIGANCKIVDNDFHPLSVEKRNPQRVEDIKKKPIEIGDGCFIGTNSIILKGTILGSNCVVGAGSVVCGSFPDNVIIAGNPAKIIKKNM